MVTREQTDTLLKGEIDLGLARPPFDKSAFASQLIHREELLLDEKTLRGVWLVRRMTAMISQNSPNQLEATERLLERIARTSTNEEFLSTLKTEL